MHPIDINKHIPQERWREFLEMFSHSNRGRKIAMELLDQEKGDELLIQAASLTSIDFQPTPEGDRINIHTDGKDSAYVHTILSPKDVWTGQDENGVVLAMDISDQIGRHTIIKLAEMKA